MRAGGTMTPETLGHLATTLMAVKVSCPPHPQGQGLLESQQSQQNPNTQNDPCHPWAAARRTEKPDPF